MSKKLFLVEDETAFLYALQAQLRLEDFDVEVASDGQKALDELKTYRPDIILLDIMLPVVDGWEVLHRIRANVDLAKIPVIILSSLSDKKSKQRARELGAEKYIVKGDYDLGGLVKEITDFAQK